MVTAVSREFRLQMEGCGLPTAEIHYHLPDYPDLHLAGIRSGDYFPELKGTRS
ncbi:hypothetical protein [Aquamicrobium terrae]|uniref:Uncharacterized protein Usg n=1 Tax=Aquamicrobium terrae TaxID=1324945 RepID=A0ABV2N3J8_9HYPH